MLLFVGNRRPLAMIVKNGLELLHPTVRHGIVSGLDQFPVLRSDRRKSLKGVEAYDAAVVIKRLMDASESRKQGHILPPPYAELHDDPVHRHDQLIELLHEVD